MIQPVHTGHVLAVHRNDSANAGGYRMTVVICKGSTVQTDGIDVSLQERRFSLSIGCGMRGTCCHPIGFCLSIKWADMKGSRTVTSSSPQERARLFAPTRQRICYSFPSLPFASLTSIFVTPFSYTLSATSSPLLSNFSRHPSLHLALHLDTPGDWASHNRYSLSPSL